MYTNKAQFLDALKSELLKRNINDNEIIEDFEQHFNIGLSEGLSEEQVCAKLGNPAEIANQYAPEDLTENVNNTQNVNQTSGNTNYNQTQQTSFAENNYNYNNANANTNAPQNNSDDNLYAVKIAGVVCLDVFVLIWAIPTLFSLLISYWAVMASFFAAPIIILAHIFIGGPIFGSLISVSMLTPAMAVFAALILFGIALIMSAFCVSIWRGFGKLMQAIGRLHYETFTGKKATF